jgi:DNA (cytosine-5)-methyltransferase 1
MRFSRFKREPTANVRHDPTIVTEYIRDCFSHLPFGDRLESIPFGENTKRLRRKLIRKRRLEMPAPLHDGAADLSIADRNRTRKVKPGDTISTLRDDVGSGTKWKREVSMGSLDVDRWFARVQKVSKTRRGQRVFDVIWYYRPEDTLCGLMKYPWSNELFLSDHCSCEEASKITEDQILGVHDVDFWGTSATQQELFCRQTYISGDRKWITLEKKHLYCDHVCYDGAADEPNYRVGDTVLLSLKSRSDRSEPCEIVELEGHSKKIRIRQLLRRRDVDASASLSPPNELVWSDKLVYSKRSRILSACHIRFFRSGTEIPTPYNRGGVGAFYFITHKHLADGSCKPLTEQPPSLRQGFDPYQELPRLRGLDLFCGGGNFGRGLEDGNAIEMRWLNDYNEQAVHTYMANVPNPEAVHPFLGSIDDLQRQAMLGNFSDKVPKIGEVDFISAGSPCPGFSNLTNDKTTAQQRKNQSLVAAFGSFVDLYRPQYGLLENVRGIVQKKANRDQDVFSQLICAVVGLGYQTRFFFLDASSCGSPQARPRVFLAFAAPGCRLPNKPQITHSHPPTAKSLSLGLLPNGEAMAEREMPDATPFKFVSAAEACDDLPRIYDAKPDTCIPYPDHRVAIGTTRDIRLQMSAIPTQPWGMNFAMAWYGMDKKKAGSGVFTQADRDLFPADEGKRTMGRTLANSSAYGRMHPHRPLNTIVTRQSPGDAKAGQQLHWREPRAITLMEARRAQGFRDHEVLLGSVREQYKIVGNSVAREVAVALGLMFREAEFGSLTDGEEDLSRLMGVDLTDEAECSDDEEVDLSDCPVSRMTSSSSRTSTMTSSQRSTPATTVKRSNSPLSIVVEIPSAKRQRYDRAVSGRAYWKAQASPLRRASDTVAVDELA